MSLAENLKLIHTVESRYDKEYQAFKSVSKELNKLKTILILHKSEIEHMDEVSRVEFWSNVEDALRLCAKKLEESHSPTDDEMLEMAKEDRPISRRELGLHIRPPIVLME